MPPTRRLLSALLALPLAAAPAAGQGFTLSADSMRLTLSGRVQTVFNTTDVPGFAATEFALRRVRLEARIRVNDVVSGKVQPEYAGSRVQLRDAFVSLDLHPALQLVAGQAHRPFSHVTMTSSTRIAPIERGVRLRGLAGAWDHAVLLEQLGYADRDVGVQAMGAPRGAPLGLSYAAGVFNGPLRGELPSASSIQLAGRVDVRPVAWVRAGAAWSRRDFVEDAGASSPVLRAGHAWEADVELGSARSGPRLVAEVAAGDTDPFLDARFLASQGWLSYRTGPVGASVSGVEPLLRVSYADADRGAAGAIPDVTGGVLLTPGVNVWLGGLNRVAVNWDAWAAEHGDSARGLKVLFQLVF